MKIVVEDCKFLVELLKTIKDKRIATFEISKDGINISVLHLEAYHIHIQPSLYHMEDDLPATFSINPTSLLTYLADFMNSPFTIVIDECLSLIYDGPGRNKRVDIPLSKLSIFEYSYHESSTKLLVNGFGLLSIFTTIVTYEKEGPMLVISTVVNGAKQKLSFGVDWVEGNDLFFRCNNSWVSCVKEITSEIDTVMLEFTPNVMIVKVLFKSYADSYFEVQIPKSLAPDN